jgi:hypothetical protein
VQKLDRLGLGQLHCSIESQSAVQYNSSKDASFLHCAVQNIRTSDGGKDGREGAI